MQFNQQNLAKIITFAELAKQQDLTGKKVLIRADLNVPQDAAGNITDDTRLKSSIACIKQAISGGAAVLVMSHLGRPKEGLVEAKYSLAPVAERLGELLGQKVQLVTDWFSDFSLAAGQVVLLENCRFLIGEKSNDDSLAKKMATLADIYVNDAFGTAHRAHASTHGVAKYAKLACAGPLLYGELAAISTALSTPKRPLVAIVGGSKVSTKLTVLNNLLEKVDGLILGGGIANTFALAQGFAVGKSLVETELVEQAKQIISKANNKGVKLSQLLDVVVAKEVTAQAATSVKASDAVAEDEMILDIGPQTAAQLEHLIATAGTVVWNGPVGVFELEPFAAGTKKLAQAIAASSAFSLAGGGDTLAAITKFAVGTNIDYISTGGGAFLEMLEGKMLPAVEVLMSKNIGN